MHISNYQRSVLSKLQEIFPETLFHYTINYRPDFLLNEKTGRNLEIDIYIEEILDCPKRFRKPYSFGIEVQGQQHFFKVKTFFNDTDDTKYKDSLKRKLADKHDIPIIEIFYSEINPDMDILSLILERSKHIPFKQLTKLKGCFRKCKIEVDWKAEHQTHKINKEEKKLRRKHRKKQLKEERIMFGSTNRFFEPLSLK